MLKTLLLTGTLVSLHVHAAEFDKIQKLNGVNLKTLKEKSLRTYTGTTEKTLPYPIDLVKKGVTNFTDRCNNSYKDKRKFISEDFNCKYHNETIVETFVEKNIREMEYFKEVSDVFVLGRVIYNRGLYGYYELVTVKEEMTDKKQKSVVVSIRMLDDKEVKLYTTPKFSKESSFDESHVTITMTEVSPSETHLRYDYSASTDHWLLNKEVSVPQVFASISKSINTLLKTVEEESYSQTREIASKE